MNIHELIFVSSRHSTYSFVVFFLPPSLPFFLSFFLPLFLLFFLPPASLCAAVLQERDMLLRYRRQDSGRRKKGFRACKVGARSRHTVETQYKTVETQGNDIKTTGDPQ